MRNGLFGLAFAGFLSSVAHAAGPQLISADDYGDAWPFTVDEMHLSCFPGDALVVADAETGVMYPLNGTAKAKASALGLEPIDKVWRADPDIAGAKVSLGPVIEQGLPLCK
ncbi:DUF2511 domain-containing protein [Pseudomonas spirodelae]|uniref:DUF2511 domain-containing protein n=1 Tax=Pseudomonas spirodelae TaxID=3101751 RepID=A0ABU5P903_9PSED|nr:DUF2511 domain-containing protein [Pseudomonas sp. T5W1]MEA1606137.1 DUF2511 domain-containing protein [Pseudomonas sp. T5W1]